MAFGEATDILLRVPPLLIADFMLSRNLLNRFPLLEESASQVYPPDSLITQLPSANTALSVILLFLVLITLLRVSLATRQSLLAFYRTFTLQFCIGTSTYAGWYLLQSAKQGITDEVKLTARYVFGFQLVSTTLIDVLSTRNSRILNSAWSRIATISCVFCGPVWISLPEFNQSSSLVSSFTLRILRSLQLLGGTIQATSVLCDELNHSSGIRALFRLQAEVEEPQGAQVPDRIISVFERIGELWTRVRMPRVLIVLAFMRAFVDCVATPISVCSSSPILRDAFSLEDVVRTRISDHLDSSASTANCTTENDCRFNPLRPFESSNRIESVSSCAYEFSRRLGAVQWADIATMRLCDNMLALFAAAACMSYASKVCSSFFATIVFGRSATTPEPGGNGEAGGEGGNEEGEAERQSVGSVAAVLFVVLALQSGLTSSPADPRRVRLARHVLLIVVANMHVIERMCEARLTQLASRSDLRVARHVRVLLVAAFLLIAAPCCVFVLRASSPSGTFLLAVIVFNAELFVKTVCALLVYAIFATGTLRSQSPAHAAETPAADITSESDSDSESESEDESAPVTRSRPRDDEDAAGRMDELVYRVKAFASVFEFTCGCILLLNGLYIIIFESASIIRAIMMLLHAYANIWTQARRGWLAYRTRRLAFAQLARLRTCSPSDVRQYKDVCAICYRHMHALSQTVLKTHCDHMFHLVCLKKWLFARDSCPLCLQNAYGLSPSSTAT